MEKLGFGLMRLPLKDDNFAHIDLERVKKMADAFIEAGGTYFDTAYPYHEGKSEEVFREAVVKRYPRESFTITDKLPMFSITRAEQMPEIFDEQLSRCGVDYFDYYWLHALGSRSYETVQRIGAFEFISQKKKEGKIRHIGFSFHDTADVLDRILTDHPETEYVQLQLNYLDWKDSSVQARECYETATRHGKPVIVMEPIKGGALASIPEKAEKLFKEKEPELSIASWAVRYAASLDNVMMVLSGMSNEEQMADNLRYMKDFQPLDEDEQRLVEQAADIIRNSIAIPCTACRYCVKGCPKGIAIPDYFDVYNVYMRFRKQQKGHASGRYKDIARKHGRASECIRCGLCENSCPQHLPIRDYLQEVAAELE